MTDTVQGNLTILADNIVPGKSEILGEHGFSVYLETSEGNFLFDTGRGKTIIHNAVVCRKDLKSLRKVILSHGHADHTGGLPEVLRFHGQIDVLGHPDIFISRFRMDGSGNRKYSGIPYAKGYLEKKGARFVFNTESIEIENGIYLTGEVPRTTRFEAADMENRFAERMGEIVPEVISDDQAMVIKTKGGILIVLGCAHSGIINTINHAVKITGADTIFGIVGGTHLGFSGETQLKETIEALKTYQIQNLIPAHCTGIPASIRLSQQFEKIFQFSYAGKPFHF